VLIGFVQDGIYPEISCVPVALELLKELPAALVEESERLAPKIHMFWFHSKFPFSLLNLSFELLLLEHYTVR